MTREPSESDAMLWAAKLIKAYSSDVIVTPVYLEFVAGTKSTWELKIARAYLSALRILDKGKILDRDWVEARRLAERIRRDGKPRHLGDCLIKAIANRFRYEVLSSDQGFPT